MEIEPKSSKLYAIIALYDLHTTFFKNVLAGISDADAHERLATEANHVAWIAGSLVAQRYHLASLLGKDTQSSSHELFKNNKGLVENAIYPSLTVYLTDWEKVSPVVRALLLAATDEQLAEIITFPGMSFPLFEMISFDCYREANCIGQIALWRRLLGYEPMKYM